jgi:F0F1-type ATP synthase assembly protein I
MTNGERLNALTGYVLALWHCIGSVVAENPQRLSSARSVKFLQENLRRGEPGMMASYALVGAVIVLGGIGYALDQWTGSSPWFLVAGLIVGISVGFYNLANTVWRR